MKRIFVVVCFCILWLCVSITAEESATSDDVNVLRQSMRQSLKGFSQVKVDVFLPPEDELVGMKARDLQNYIELELRKHGISVVSGSPFTGGDFQKTVQLVFDIHASHKITLPTGTTRAISFQLQVLQPVTLFRDPSVKTIAVTWSSDRLTAFEVQGQSADREFVQKDISKLTGAFATDLLSVNPPLSSHTQKLPAVKE